MVSETALYPLLLLCLVAPALLSLCVCVKVGRGRGGGVRMDARRRCMGRIYRGGTGRERTRKRKKESEEGG